MQKPSNLLPEGFHDALPPYAEAASRLERDVLDTLASHGYARVTPPLAEYEDGLTQRMQGGSRSDLIRLVDPISQRTLALRPDMTMQIGRIASTSLAERPRPLRLSYSGQVLKLRSGQLQPERSRLQIGAELIGTDSVIAACEIVFVAIAALERAGVSGITVDFTMPDLIDILAAGPLPLNQAQLAEVRGELDMKDAGGLKAMGATGYLPLIEATGPFDEAMAKLRAFDGDGLLGSRLDGVAQIAESIRGKADLTLDPTERHGFEYQNWFGFTLYAESFIGALGRGGSYVIAHADGEAEAAVGFSLYPDPLINAGFGAKTSDQIFLPLGHDRTAAAKLRETGWRTVAALSETDEAQALGCSHILNGDQPEPL
ncbi:MAG: ATP phosphoribosyltransferase regulatory subunit [Sphingomonadales bacterium]|nr:ATP phosphoribosyltransferase regulatory subunit [Sphingomonadales bacterium]PIX66678.1 MAG: ATP phosphoribosyltransferase regulatory subunit [Sphingomonadales bacterium CG_4_10_14_3_um_filter_58_15]NCO48498.1 ATP phosphoribosyltransferase regulatory subunit [Sphingomonadales bacterium]NCO99314.1 ATP phosphoribosyltransferase regulatory subunit [Sphingomonadales bacterium]NCP27873.1 ATP phosphoribosyltransferase regulatory subunit [Sphingomonadales bacterium]